MFFRKIRYSDDLSKEQALLIADSLDETDPLALWRLGVTGNDNL